MLLTESHERLVDNQLKTAGKLITEKNPKQNKQKKEIYKII